MHKSQLTILIYVVTHVNLTTFSDEDWHQTDEASRSTSQVTIIITNLTILLLLIIIIIIINGA